MLWAEIPMAGQLSALFGLSTVTKIAQSTGAYRVSRQTMQNIAKLDTKDVLHFWIAKKLLLYRACRATEIPNHISYGSGEGGKRTFFHLRKLGFISTKLHYSAVPLH